MSRVSGCLVLFGLIWFSLVGLANYTVGGNLVRQWQANSWTPVTARVLSSQVEVDDDGDSKSYIPHIEYQYRVGERDFQSRRVRFGLNFTSSSWAHGLVQRYAAGATVNAYYQPEHPEEALLDRGLSPQDLLALIFLLPFNLVGLGMLAAPWLLPRGEAGFPVSRERRQVFIHIHYFHPLLAAGLALFLASFAAIFINAIGLALNMSLSMCLAQLVLLGFIGVHAGLSTHRRNRDRNRAVRLDNVARRIGLPGHCELSYERVRQVLLEAIEGKDSDGDSVWRQRVSLQLDEDESVEVHSLQDPQKARQLADFLQRALDCHEPPREVQRSL